MATLVIPGALQVSLHFSVSGQEVVNVLGFTSDEIMPAETAANIVHDAWIATGGPHKQLPNTVTLNRVKATELSSLTGPVYERSASAVGGIAGALNSLATTAVVRIGAGTRSRSGKGRVYFGPLSTLHMNNDGRTLAAGTITSIQSAFNQFRTACATANLDWAVLSRKLSIATPVDSVSVASVIGTQRRRIR